MGAWHNYGRHWHCTSLEAARLGSAKASGLQCQGCQRGGCKGSKGGLTMENAKLECQLLSWPGQAITTDDDDDDEPKERRMERRRRNHRPRKDTCDVLRPFPPLPTLDVGMLKSIKHALNYEQSEEFSLWLFSRYMSGFFFLHFPAISFS